jgi:hypothetical protein
MKKSNWACSKCGMNSSRKWSVSRHIEIVHSGSGLLLTYTDYLAGVSDGHYFSRPIPSFSTVKKGVDYETIVKEEFCREMARGFARNYSTKISENPLLSPVLLKGFPLFLRAVVAVVNQKNDERNI